MIEPYEMLGYTYASTSWWNQQNPILLPGKIAWEVNEDGNAIGAKMGDGVNTFDSLPYMGTLTALPTTNEQIQVTIDGVQTSVSNMNDLLAGNLTAQNIRAGSITASSMATKTITAASGVIDDAAINTANIQTGAITTALISNSAVQSAQIADGSITSAKVVDLTADKITAGTLSVDRLVITGNKKSIVYAVNEANGTAQLSQTSIDGGALTQRSITADKIVAQSITSDEIAANTITSNQIAANSITASNINVADLITAMNVSTDVLYAGRITTKGSNVFGIIGDWTGAPSPGAEDKTLSGFILKDTAGNERFKIITGIYDVIGAGNKSENAVLFTIPYGIRFTTYNKDSNGEYSIPGSSIAMEYNEIDLSGHNPDTGNDYGLSVSDSGINMASSQSSANMNISVSGKNVTFTNSLQGGGVYLGADGGVNVTNKTNNGYVPIMPSAVYMNGDSGTSFRRSEGGTVILTSTYSSLYLQTVRDVNITNPAGNAYQPINASAFNSGSLEELKQDIAPLASVLPILHNSQVYAYRLKNDMQNDIDHKKYGFVIGDGYQTPQEVLSENGEAVNQYSMAAILWRAVQEIEEKATQQINSLQAQIDALQVIITDLQAK